VKTMIDYQVKISTTRNLKIPQVDTIVVYSSFLPTKTAFLFDSVKNQIEFENIDVLSRGGDGTVSSWSSLLVGLKWIYDKYNDKDNVLPQNIQLVEFCSLLSKSGKEYLYDKKAKTPQEFSVLSCDCLDSDGLYKTEETSANKCSHSEMISDKKIIKFIEDNLIDEDFQFGEEIVDFLKNFRNVNYEDECNKDLLNIVQEQS
jgi:hypothetical protein